MSWYDIFRFISLLVFSGVMALWAVDTFRQAQVQRGRRWWR